VLRVTVNEPNVVQILGNVIHGAADTACRGRASNEGGLRVNRKAPASREPSRRHGKRDR
jgi:hypothetical protein